MKGIVSGGRYDIILFPVVAFFSGSFYLRLIPKPKIIIPVLLILALVDISLFSPLSYLDYSNDKYFKERGRYYSWGMGGYEIAQKANLLPDADNLKVLSDYHGFGHFFVGKNAYMNKSDAISNDYLKNFDYLCLSSSGRKVKETWHLMTPAMKYYYDQSFDDAKFYVGSLERGYVKLVTVDKSREDLTIAGCYDPNFLVCLAKPLSIGFWLKTGSHAPEDPIYIGEDFRRGISLHWLNHNNTAMLELRYNEQNALKTDVLNDNQWHHILFSQQGGNVADKVCLFVDGALKDCLILSKEKKEIEKFFINTKFFGKLQDIRIYDFVLSQHQINAIYNNGKIRLDRELFDGNKKFNPITHFIIKTKKSDG